MFIAKSVAESSTPAECHLGFQINRAFANNTWRSAGAAGFKLDYKHATPPE